MIRACALVFLLVVSSGALARGPAPSGQAPARSEPGPQPGATSPQVPRLVTGAKDVGTAFDRFETTDAFGRTITFYVSANRDPAAPKPIGVWVQGSGCTSVFSKLPDGRVAAGLQGLLFQQADRKMIVVCVEKPGVTFGDFPDNPGSAQGCSKEFLEEHTLERWTEAVRAALEAACTLPGVDPTRVLAAGHSEGAIIAAHVAARSPLVTHAAVLSGGGPSQLFAMSQLARRPRSPDEPPAEAEKRVEAVYDAWARIAADPMSTEKFEWGHPYRRWSTFMKSSVLDALLQSSARIYIAYGTLDPAEPVESGDALRAELVRRGRDVVCDRRIGEDHGYSPVKEGQDQGAVRRDPGNFPLVLKHVADWFLNPAPESPKEQAPQR